MTYKYDPPLTWTPSPPLSLPTGHQSSTPPCARRSKLKSSRAVTPSWVSRRATANRLLPGSGRGCCCRRHRLHHAAARTRTDRFNDLDERGVIAVQHPSAVDAERRKRIISDLTEEDEPSISLLYLTPEGLAKPEMVEVLQTLHARKLLRAIAVDEAHCVSQWGHSFRSDYLGIAAVRDQLGAPHRGSTSIAVEHAAAAATMSSRTYGSNRPQSCSARMTGQTSSSRLSTVESMGDAAAEEAALIDFCATTEGTGIVYCRTKKEVDRISDVLCDSIDADAYHAGKEEGRRKRTQSEWTSGDLRVVVATIAFGMGVNKASVRFVVHWDPPSTLENLLQEAAAQGEMGSRDSAALLHAKTTAAARLATLPKGCVRRLCTASGSACRRALLLAHFEAQARKIATAAATAAASAPNTDAGPPPERCCDLCANRLCRSRATATFLAAAAAARADTLEQWLLTRRTRMGRSSRRQQQRRRRSRRSSRRRRRYQAALGDAWRRSRRRQEADGGRYYAPTAAAAAATARGRGRRPATPQLARAAESSAPVVLFRPNVRSPYLPIYTAAAAQDGPVDEQQAQQAKGRHLLLCAARGRW